MKAPETSIPRIGEFGHLRRDLRIAVAVSGGSDSVALLRLILDWRGSSEGLFVLTVDHQLRAASRAEARKVAAWCKELGVKHTTLRWQHAPVSSGLQAKARKARYDLMTAWCKRREVETLLTAHTLNDQAETVAMRAKRTKSAKALSGIWPETEWNGVRIHRPLLGVTRHELRTYLKDIEQEWIEDPSNDDERFERVRVRKAGPNPELAQLAVRMQEKSKLAAAGAKAWAKQNLRVAAPGMITFAPSAFSSLDSQSKHEALLRIVSLAGGGKTDAAERERLAQWIGTQGSARRTLGGAIFAKRQREILVGREPGRIPPAPIKVSSTKPVIWDNRFRVTAPKGSTIVLAASIKTLKRIKNIPAFIQAGWPAVMRRGLLLATPYLQHDRAVKVEFINK